MKFPKGNTIAYMQDDEGDWGIPHDVEFKVTKVSKRRLVGGGWQLRADGYGGDPYGNGRLFVWKNHLRPDERTLFEKEKEE